MCTEPVKQTRPPLHAPDKSADSSNAKDLDTSISPKGKDLEGGYALNDIPDPEVIKEAARFKDLTFAQIVDQIWHFCSVDYGPKCKQPVDGGDQNALTTLPDTCIGYNSLYTTTGVKIENGEGLPEGKRIWSWLILCNDGSKPLLRWCRIPASDSSQEPSYLFRKIHFLALIYPAQTSAGRSLE